MSRHLSVRVDEDVVERLDVESRRAGRSRSWLAKRLLEEGLRMERHPGIVFRSGPAGRRPGLMGGPDVWEVARVAVGGENTWEEVAELTGLLQEQVGVALRYYAEYRDEIDAWIRMVDQEAERAKQTGGAGKNFSPGEAAARRDVAARCRRGAARARPRSRRSGRASPSSRLTRRGDLRRRAGGGSGDRHGGRR